MNIRIKDYIIFIYSNDANLFKFCEYICSTDSYKENILQGFLNSYRIKNKNHLSLFTFLKIINLTNAWIEMRSICKLILKNHENLKRKIKYEEFGCIVSQDFIKYNYSLNDRINVLKKIIEERI